MERLTVFQTDKGRYSVRPIDWEGIWDKQGRIQETGIHHIAIFDEKEEAEFFAKTKDMEEQGKLLILPCKLGDTVHVITRCNYIPEVLDGDMYEPDGSPGDATGFYCPYELSQKCPHDCEEFTRCEDYKYKRAVFEDTVSQIHIAEDDMFIVCKNTGIYWKIGKDIFLTEQKANEALAEMEEKNCEDISSL